MLYFRYNEENKGIYSVELYWNKLWDTCMSPKVYISEYILHDTEDGTDTVIPANKVHKFLDANDIYGVYKKYPRSVNSNEYYIIFFDDTLLELSQQLLLVDTKYLEKSNCNLCFALSSQVINIFEIIIKGGVEYGDNTIKIDFDDNDCCRLQVLYYVDDLSRFKSDLTKWVFLNNPQFSGGFSFVHFRKN